MSILLCKLYSTSQMTGAVWGEAGGLKLVGAHTHFVACRSVAVIKQTNLSGAGHTTGPSLSSPTGISMWEQ